MATHRLRINMTKRSILPSGTSCRHQRNFLSVLWFARWREVVVRDASKAVARMLAEHSLAALGGVRTPRTSRLQPSPPHEHTTTFFEASIIHYNYIIGSMRAGVGQVYRYKSIHPSYHNNHQHDQGMSSFLMFTMCT